MRFSYYKIFPRYSYNSQPQFLAFLHTTVEVASKHKDVCVDVLFTVGWGGGVDPSHVHFSVIAVTILTQATLSTGQLMKSSEQGRARLPGAGRGTQPCTGVSSCCKARGSNVLVPVRRATAGAPSVPSVGVDGVAGFPQPGPITARSCRQMREHTKIKYTRGDIIHKV